MPDRFAEQAQRTGRFCTEEGCDQPHYAKGLCPAHYRRVQRTGSTERRLDPDRGCTVEGCERKHSAKGLCKVHYNAAVRAARRPAQPQLPAHSGRYCTEAGCDKPFKAMGLCKKHYMQARRALAPKAEPKVRKRHIVKKARPVVEVTALYSYPDEHRHAPGGQRLAVYRCPACRNEHMVSWGPFDEHPGEKLATCRGIAAGGDSSLHRVLVKAPPESAQHDSVPAERRDRGVALPKVQRVLSDGTTRL